MKRRSFVSKVSRSRVYRSAAALLVGVATLLGGLALSKPAAAQEIQLTGPLAGAPAVRQLRNYREGRFEIAIGPGFTLLDEYQRTIFVAGRLQYNVTDWLGLGVFGGFGAANISTDLTDQINARGQRTDRTATNLPSNKRAEYADQTGKLKWMAAPQVTFSPFRGKLALFQKLFVDTDLYIHGGAAFVGVEERADCALGKCASSFDVASRTAIAPTFGLGLTLYASGFVNLNLEYRAYPFSWNRGGFDTRGSGPDASFPDNRINEEDRTFKFNQMFFVALGFYLPTSPSISE